MNLSKFDVRAGSEKGATMQLRDPGSGVPLIDEKTKNPITITLLGKDSDKYTNAFRKLSDARLDNSVNAGMRLKLNTAQLEFEQVEVLVAVTTGWNGLRVGDNDEELPFSEAAARDVYTKHSWIREQADAFISNRGNFLGNL